MNAAEPSRANTNRVGAGMGTDWVTVPGSDTTNRLVTPADPSLGSVFLRPVLRRN